MAYSQDNAMDEVMPRLWIGSIRAVSDVESLRKHNIHSVLSAMRGRVKVAEVSIILSMLIMMQRNLTIVAT